MAKICSQCALPYRSSVGTWIIFFFLIFGISNLENKGNQIKCRDINIHTAISEIKYLKFCLKAVLNF